MALGAHPELSSSWVSTNRETHCANSRRRLIQIVAEPAVLLDQFGAVARFQPGVTEPLRLRAACFFDIVLTSTGDFLGFPNRIAIN